ncbi:MAG: hypothetical protein PHG21_11460 [Azoarcus sp.]|nr:hypothetical protein [Azoarcus sp.]
MNQRSFTFLTLFAASALLAGCGQTQTEATVDIAWPERQSIYRLNPERTQVDVYSFRNGIAPLGSIRLPAGLCPVAMTLDEPGNRLWLWSDRGGVAFDARSLRQVQRWSASVDTPSPVPPGVALRSMIFRTGATCKTLPASLQAMAGK